MALCVGAMAATVAAGCGGGDDESTANDEPVEVSAASEPAKVFAERMAKLLETTTAKKDCAPLEQIVSRSATQLPCPAPKKFRDSMASFEIVGAEEYGTSAIVDYKSGNVKEGAAIVLAVAPDRGWGVSRFGILTKPSTETSDAENREGYAKAVDEFLTSVRERDCDAYVAVTFNGDKKKDEVCKDVFPATSKLAKTLEANPDAKPRYEGGNETYGFYTLEVAKPKRVNYTISMAEADSDKKGPRPFVVLDVTESPTAFQQKQARRAFRQSQKPQPKQDMTPSSKPSDPAVTTP